MVTLKMGMGSLSRWLDVEVGTDDIDLNTLPSNLALADVYNDNEIKLLVGCLGKGEEGPMLKVFRGATQLSDMALPDLPLGITTMHTNDSVPRSVPVVAVAFSSCVYVYRNMKLFYKYYLPTFELSSCEVEVWKQLTNPLNHSSESVAPLADSLKAIPVDILSAQSRNFIAMTADRQLEYLEHTSELPARKLPEVACITKLNMHSSDRHAVSCLVVGTEDGDVILLHSQTFTTLAQAPLCAVKKTPYQMLATGLFNVDYRITVTTREKCVCILKRGWTEGRLLFNTEDHIIAIEVMPTDNSVIIICADHTLQCYTRKGKKQWCLTLEHRPIAMSLLPILHLGMTLTAVSLASGHVHLYLGKARRDTLFVRDVATVMKFGQLGQEEHVFIIITGNGNLQLKILKRTADFSGDGASIHSTMHTDPVHKPWLIPKKSKLFLEQSVRERENAAAMHESFQLEVNRLRLTAAKTLLDAHLKGDHSVAAGSLEPLRMSAEVAGLGPVFRVTLSIENTSTEKAVIGLSILFHVNPAHYKITNHYIKVPLLSPNSSLKFPTKIEEIFEENLNPDVFFRTVTGQGGERSLVKILLLKDNMRSPVLAATVQMPGTDPMMLPLDKLNTGFENQGFGS